MEDVTEAITRGLAKARDAIASFSRRLNPSINTTELENTAISFSVDWELIQLSLVSATGLTAHDRYHEWYQQQFRGQKRPHFSDEEYKDTSSDRSESISGSDVSSTDSTRASLTRTVSAPSVVFTRSQKVFRKT